MARCRLVGVTLQQLEEMKRRLAGRSRQSEDGMPDSLAVPFRAHRCILGIDPSLRGTGFGIIKRHPTCPQVLALGVVDCPSKWPRSRCLVAIAQALRDAIRVHQPTVCAIEGLFYAQNHQTTLIMGEARGACLLAAAEAGLPICEIAPRKVKQAVVGYGAAKKLVVAKMVQRMLHLESVPQADAADALAIALAFLQENRGLTAQSMKWV